MSERSRQDEKAAYDHQSERSTGGDSSTDAMLEHREAASGSGSERNELTPGERQSEPDRRGPTTHHSTTTVSKD